MDFAEFEARAEQIFDAIPPAYREGVDGLEIERRTVLHPTLPEIYTLGECLSESYPSDFGGAGEVRSRVVLYYGSFLELSRSRDDWDWEEELFETITHEVRHHLEHLASDDALGEMDYAEDQNFARREGRAFEPFFFRSGNVLGPGVFEVDGDIFIEREIGGREIEQRDWIGVEWPAGSLEIELPADLGDIHFLQIGDVPGEHYGKLYVVLVRRPGLIESIIKLLRSQGPRVLESEGRAR